MPVPIDFYQPDTDTNTFMVGVEEKWSQQFDTYVRMKFINTAYPLYGITPYVGSNLDQALNTCLPTDETRMEIGATWTPSERFLANGTFYVEDASNHGPYGYFNSTNYPFLFSVMYAPTQAWHSTAGYANFDQSLTQNINIGVPRRPPRLGPTRARRTCSTSGQPTGCRRRSSSTATSSTSAAWT